MTSFTIKNKAVPFKIEAFRATENRALALKFLKAHAAELEKIGVKNIASSEPAWMKDPNVIVLCLISLKDRQMLAGMKIDIWHERKTLPIIRSLSNQPFSIEDIVRTHSQQNIAEICGLWVSSEAGGMGMSKILIRAAVSILPTLGIGKSVAFASQYTIKTIQHMGYEVYSEIGDKGMFPYPTDDFKSYVALLHDTSRLRNSDRREKKLITELRKNPMLMRLENEKGKNSLIEYNLGISPVQTPVYKME